MQTGMLSTRIYWPCFQFIGQADRENISFIVEQVRRIKIAQDHKKNPTQPKKPTQVTNKSLFILIQCIYCMEIKMSKILNTEQTELLYQHL